MDQRVEERVRRHGQGAEGGGVGDGVEVGGVQGGGEEWSVGDLCSAKLPGLCPSLPTGKVIVGFRIPQFNSQQTPIKGDSR